MKTYSFQVLGLQTDILFGTEGVFAFSVRTRLIDRIGREFVGILWLPYADRTFFLGRKEYMFFQLGPV